MQPLRKELTSNVKEAALTTPPDVQASVTLYRGTLSQLSTPAAAATAGSNTSVELETPSGSNFGDGSGGEKDQAKRSTRYDSRGVQNP